MCECCMTGCTCIPVGVKQQFTLKILTDWRCVFVSCNLQPTCLWISVGSYCKWARLLWCSQPIKVANVTTVGSLMLTRAGLDSLRTQLYSTLTEQLLSDFPKWRHWSFPLWGVSAGTRTITSLWPPPHRSGGHLTRGNQKVKQNVFFRSSHSSKSVNLELTTSISV